MNNTQAPWLKKKNKPLVTEFGVPQKHINGPEDIKKWVNTKAYEFYTNFLRILSNHLKRKENIEYNNFYKQNEKCSVLIEELIKVVNEIDKIVDNTSLVEKKSIQRFGNPGYRDFFDKMKKKSTELIKNLLGNVGIKKIELWMVKELSTYLSESFGNRTRIDYGSGHEASFAFFLACFKRLNLLKTDDDHVFLVTKVFNRYILIVRKIQIKYNLEPAGSHGCWGLDDFQFLPYLWGAAQLVNHKEIFPKDVLNEELHKTVKDKYLYFDAIAYINSVKRGPFREHSAVLHSLLTVKHWKKILSGMIKMYDAEVLRKYVVVQHFLFGKLMPYEDVE